MLMRLVIGVVMAAAAAGVIKIPESGCGCMQPGRASVVSHDALDVLRGKIHHEGGLLGLQLH